MLAITIECYRIVATLRLYILDPCLQCCTLSKINWMAQYMYVCLKRPLKCVIRGAIINNDHVIEKFQDIRYGVRYFFFFIICGNNDPNF